VRIYVDADVPNTLAGKVWLERLRMWLQDAPEDVITTLREADGPLGDVVNATEVIEFLRSCGISNPPYNGRSTFYYLVEHLCDRLVVLCTQCTRRYRECRCEDRGCEYGGEWVHTGYISPSEKNTQGFWVVERAGLVALDLESLPHDHVALRRERVLLFLRSLKK